MKFKSNVDDKSFTVKSFAKSATKKGKLEFDVFAHLPF